MHTHTHASVKYIAHTQLSVQSLSRMVATAPNDAVAAFASRSAPGTNVVRLVCRGQAAPRASNLGLQELKKHVQTLHAWSAYYGFHDAFWIFPCSALLAFFRTSSLYPPHNQPALGDANAPSWWPPTIAVRLRAGFYFRAQLTSQHGRAGREKTVSCSSLPSTLLGSPWRSRLTHGLTKHHWVAHQSWFTCLTPLNPTPDSPIVKRYLHCMTAHGNLPTTRSFGNAAAHDSLAREGVGGDFVIHTHTALLDIALGRAALPRILRNTRRRRHAR